MPARFRVEITASAERDVTEIHAYIARDKPEAAAKWVREIERHARNLRALPLRHEVIPEAAELGVEYRHLILGAYRLLYRVEGKRVIVLRVIHSARLLNRGLFD